MILYASYLLQAPDSGKTKDQVFYWLNKAVDAGDLDAKRFMDERGAELSAVYERTKKPLNAYEPQKKCPMVKRCTSYQTNRGVETSKSCVAVPDYWNC